MLVAGLAAGAALLVLPSLAGAIVYCVPNDTVDPSCDSGQGQATIQGALTAAQNSTTDADTVHVDAGSYNEAGLSYNGATSTNVLTLVGEGTGQTLLTIPDTTGTPTGLSITAPAGSTVSDLAMTIPANADANGDRGIDLSGSTLGQNLLVNGPAATNAIGVRLFGSSSLADSTVDLPFATPSNIAVLGAGSTTTANDLNLHANNGVREQGNGSTLTVERTTIQASSRGASLDTGTIIVRNSLIDLGSNSGAVGVQPANFNNGLNPISAIVNGVTIVGSGPSQTGIQVQADSAVASDPNDTVHDGEDATATVANTVISGPTTSLKLQADRGETATLTTSYSNYDSSTKVVTSDLTGGGGTGTANLTESNQTNLAPGFVGGGDFHLAPGSPLIDIGDPAHPSPGDLDIDGDAREIFGEDGCGPRRDIGADEFMPLTSPTLLDCIPPDTSILTGPSGTITSNTPTFTFDSSEVSSTFECSIDGGAFAACSSPFTTPPLSDGPHTFAVKAVDASLNEDPLPASRSFTVDTSSPPPADTTVPETAIGSHPKPKTKHRRATFTFGSSEPGSSFLCSYDGKAYVPCTSPFTTPKLKRGRHRFDVLATDSAGNRDQTAATFRWKVIRRKRR
jgi:hypothetical protein